MAIKLIVRGADALAKAFRAGVPYDMTVRFHKGEGDDERVVTEHFAPGETVPFGAMEMIGPNASLASSAMIGMLMPTLQDRMVARLDYQKVMVSLRSFEIDGRVMTIKEMFGVDPFGGGQE